MNNFITIAYKGSKWQVLGLNMKDGTVYYGIILYLCILVGAVGIKSRQTGYTGWGTVAAIKAACRANCQVR